MPRKVGSARKGPADVQTSSSSELLVCFSPYNSSFLASLADPKTDRTRSTQLSFDLDVSTRQVIVFIFSRSSLTPSSSTSPSPMRLRVFQFSKRPCASRLLDLGSTSTSWPRAPPVSLEPISRRSANERPSLPSEPVSRPICVRSASARKRPRLRERMSTLWMRRMTRTRCLPSLCEYTPAVSTANADDAGNTLKRSVPEPATDAKPSGYAIRPSFRLGRRHSSLRNVQHHFATVAKLWQHL